MSIVGRDNGAARFVSYAQNAEDVLLWQALHDVAAGFYVDIGAHDPDHHSVTRAFYDRGWSGINVEPVVRYAERLRAARPRDVTLCVAAGAKDAEVELFDIPDTGLSTLDAAIARRHAASGRKIVSRQVAMRRLEAIWREHAPAAVHFLKIDVEGVEEGVIAGADLVHQRPWVVVVESTLPLTRRESQHAWEPRILAAGYELVHFDGLNRYYVAGEAAAIGARLRDAAASSMDFIRAAEASVLSGDVPQAELDFARLSFLKLDDPPPTLRHAGSQLCTRSQFDEPEYAHWCHTLGETPVLHRKQWEFAYILQVLHEAGMLAPGQRGLGFGCGTEPLAAVMAARGCEIVATDLPVGAAAAAGWAASDQHARSLEDLNSRGICDPEAFARRVTFRAQDMNAIGPELAGFDFLWSSCAFEHLGSIPRGLAFVASAMQCLKPGGVAVHTTEFNLSSDIATLEAPDLVFFRRRDIERLARTLPGRRCELLRLNLNPGTASLDRYADLPPYRDEPHLRLKLDQFVATSLGIIVRRVA